MLNDTHCMNPNKKEWYTVYTKPRHEDMAEFHLQAKGLEVFYPKLFLPIPNKAGRHAVSLFPSYLFVRIDVSSSDYFQVMWCRGIKRLVSFGGVPSAVQDDVISFLRDQGDSNGLIRARSSLKIGAEVQITKGPFKGLLGIIQEPPDTKSRVKVLMAILSRQVHVDVPVDHIDVGWVAPCPVA
jgi:transcriptional antiterminator RfaH